MVRDLLAGEAAGYGRGSGWPARLQPALEAPAFAGEVRDLLLRAAERGLGPRELRALGKEHDVAVWVAAARFYQTFEEVTLLRAAAGSANPLASAPPLDAAELVAAVLDAFASDPGLLEAERAAVRHLVVDDAQDMDPQQLELVRVLGSTADAWLLAGDPDSSVLGFRGAAPELLRDADPGGRATAVLHVDHRGSPAVRAAVARVVEPLRGTGPARTRTGPAGEDDEAGAADVSVFATPGHQAAWVADTLRRAHLVDGVPWSRLAVLVRSVPLLAAPAAAGPARRRGAARGPGRRHAAGRAARRRAPAHAPAGRCAGRDRPGRREPRRRHRPRAARLPARGRRAAGPAAAAARAAAPARGGRRRHRPLQRRADRRRAARPPRRPARPADRCCPTPTRRRCAGSPACSPPPSAPSGRARACPTWCGPCGRRAGCSSAGSPPASAAGCSAPRPTATSTRCVALVERAGRFVEDLPGGDRRGLRRPGRRPADPHRHPRAPRARRRGGRPAHRARGPRARVGRRRGPRRAGGGVARPAACAARLLGVERMVDVLAGVPDDPALSTRIPLLDEERRLFAVALSRARTACTSGRSRPRR